MTTCPTCFSGVSYELSASGKHPLLSDGADCQAQAIAIWLVHLVESVMIHGRIGVNGQRLLTSVQAESVLYGMQVELPLPFPSAEAHGVALS